MMLVRIKDIYLDHSAERHAFNQKNRFYSSVLLKVNVLGGFMRVKKIEAPCICYASSTLCPLTEGLDKAFVFPRCSHCQILGWRTKVKHFGNGCRK